MSEPPSSPKDVADVLENLARRIRSDPDLARHPPRTAFSVMTPDILPISVDTEPSLGEVDIFRDEQSVTVTAETRNVDAHHVHVSVIEGRLLIGLGEGAHAQRRDLALPAPVDEDAAFATFRNGVLDVVLPLRRAR